MASLAPPGGEGREAGEGLVVAAGMGREGGLGLFLASGRVT